MPISSEKVPNTALTGREVIELVCADVRRVLEADGQFVGPQAYRRYGCTLNIKFALDNPFYPSHHKIVKSGEPLPLAQPSEDAVERELELERTMDSPNAARAEIGLPITVPVNEVVNGQHVTTYREVEVDPNDAPLPQVVVKDLTPAKPRGKAMGLKKDE